MTFENRPHAALDESLPAGEFRSIASRRAALLTVATLCFIAIGMALFLIPPSRPQENIETHTVGRGDVVVRCVQSGKVTSVRTTKFVCEVEAATHEGYQAEGAEMLWIVPDGTIVKKDDLLVELNDTLLRELHDDWQLKVVGIEGEYKQADIGYQNQLLKWETELTSALAQLEAAEAMRGALEGIGGLELAHHAAGVGTGARELKLQQLQRVVSEVMDRLGAAGSDVATSQEARYQYQLELIKLGQALGDLEMAREFEHPLQAEEMPSVVKRAQRTLAQSQLDHEAALQQFASQRDATAKTLGAQRQRLEHYEKQMQKCRLHAPHEGVVIHASSGEEVGIGPGAIVREHQEILALHDLSALQVEVSLPKEVANQVRVGSPASIKHNPDSGRPYRAAVTQLQPSGADTRLSITPQEDFPLRFGASTTVEIQLKVIPDVVRIAWQSLLSRDGETIAYVQSEALWQQRVLTLGAAGAEYVEVVDGLTEGETIALDAAMAESAVGVSE